MLLKFLDRRGVSLIEVLLAIGIFLLLAMGAVSIFSFSLKANKIVWEQLSTQNEGRKIIQDFVNELRSANYSSIGAYPLSTVNTQEIVFYSNLDSDSYRERIRYFLSGNILKKGIIKPAGSPLAYSTSSESITNIVYDVANTSTPLFYYYGQNFGYTSSTPLAQPVNITDVRLVGIVLMLEEDPTASPAPFQIESKVEIRSLKSN